MTGQSQLPKRCQFCGQTMKDVKINRAWEGLMECSNGHRAKIVYGDQMGGADFCYVTWGNTEKEETEIQAEDYRKNSNYWSAADLGLLKLKCKKYGIKL